MSTIERITIKRYMGVRDQLPTTDAEYYMDGFNRIITESFVDRYEASDAGYGQEWRSAQLNEWDQPDARFNPCPFGPLASNELERNGS